MSRIALGLSSGLVVACLLFSCLPRPVSADPPAAEPSPPDTAVKKAPEATADKEADKHEEKALREQNIYIPYEKLRQVFEKEGRGVFLPYEKFQELWQAARDKTAPRAESQPPVGALITEIENEATVAKDVVRVKATLKIEVLAEGWHEIPLGLADAAITSAKIGGQPARIVAVTGRATSCWSKQEGKRPETLELSLEYAKAISGCPARTASRSRPRRRR